MADRITVLPRVTVQGKHTGAAAIARPAAPIDPWAGGDYRIGPISIPTAILIGATDNFCRGRAEELDVTG